MEFLNLCPKLTNLTLYGNPICSKTNKETNEEVKLKIKILFFLVRNFVTLTKDLNYSYRHEIIRLLPSLELLDDELTLNTKPLPPINSPWNAKNNSSNQNDCPFEDDWQLINEIMDEGIGPPEEKLAINGREYF